MGEKLRPKVGMRMAEYLKDAGQRCPKCRSWDVHPVGRFEENENSEVVRKVRCFECGRGFFEVYELKSWRD